MEIKNIVGIDYTMFSDEDKKKIKAENVINIVSDEASDEDITLVAKYIIFKRNLTDFEKIKEFILNSKFWIAQNGNINMLFIHTINLDGTTFSYYMEKDGHRMHYISEEEAEEYWKFVSLAFEDVIYAEKLRAAQE